MPRPFALLLLLVLGCGASQTSVANQPQQADTALHPHAEQYVKLVLALGQHDSDYVDAYYGPAEWAAEAKQTKRPLEQIGAEATELVSKLEAVHAPSELTARLRVSYLLRQTKALGARVRMLRGEVLAFDAESQALYDARAPVHSEAEFDALQSELEQLVPGQGIGTLQQRLDAYRQRFVVPVDKLEHVIQTAIDEARKRTQAHVKLPEGEHITLELVRDKTWGGYNRYQGNFHSLIQVNTDLPIFMGRVVDLAAHESYPGHHVYAALQEQHLVRERGYVEYTVLPLYSPQALISEGSANYGVELAFPDLAPFLRDVLFPLAGLPAQDAEAYANIELRMRKLLYAENEAVRRYIDKQFDQEQARDYLIRYRLMAPERADKYLKNADQVRSYVINYNLGQDLVRGYVARGEPGDAWSRFEALLSSPRLPGDLL